MNDGYNDHETVRANYDGRTRRLLHDILGRRSDLDGESRLNDFIPIAPPRTNGESWILESDEVANALLRQIGDAVKDRDEELAKYEAAKAKSDRAARETHDHWEKVRQSNHRALRLREALEAVRKVPR